jgi:hemoglobin
MKKSLLASLVLAGIALASLGTAQTDPMPMGKPTLYQRLGGIHKIADFFDRHFATMMKSNLVKMNPRLKSAMKMFPAPAAMFVSIGFTCSKIGGPQKYSLLDVSSIEKGFMLTPEEWKMCDDLDRKILRDMKIDDATAEEFLAWHTKSVMDAEPIELMPEPFMSKDSLYARLGGFAPISMVVNDFVNLLATDKTVLSNSRTVKALTDGHVSAAGLKYLVTEQLCAAAGGPFTYSGRSMASSHKGLMITEKEWDASANLLIQVLNKYKVPAREQKEILGAIIGTKKDIVGH